MPDDVLNEPRVLVVEDDSAVRVLIDRILTGRGFRVQSAASALEASAFIFYDLPQRLDLAILDVVLPGITGVEYADNLRRHFPSIRLMFMTGWQHNAPLHEEARRRAPVIEKPFTLQAFVDAVQAVMVAKPSAPPAGGSFQPPRR